MKTKFFIVNAEGQYYQFTDSDYPFEPVFYEFFTNATQFNSFEEAMNRLIEFKDIPKMDSGYRVVDFIVFQ